MLKEVFEILVLIEKEGNNSISLNVELKLNK